MKGVFAFLLALLIPCVATADEYKGVLVQPEPKQWELKFPSGESYMLGLNDKTRSLDEWANRLKPWIGKPIFVTGRQGISFGKKIGLLVDEIQLQKVNP